MKQDYIKTIKEACIKANPEIMELKFGCEVKIFGGENTKIVQNIDNKFLLSNGKFHYGEIRNKDNYEEILGRPITLEDILICLYKNGKSNVEIDFSALVPF